MTHLTHFHQRALEWLPSDGSWQGIVMIDDRRIGPIRRLFESFPDAIESREEVTARGSIKRFYRLTEAGMRLKAEMEDAL